MLPLATTKILNFLRGSNKWNITVTAEFANHLPHVLLHCVSMSTLLAISHLNFAKNIHSSVLRLNIFQLWGTRRPRKTEIRRNNFILMVGYITRLKLI